MVASRVAVAVDADTPMHLAAVLALLCQGPAAPTPQADPPKPEIQVEIVSRSTQIAPGELIEVGAHFSLPEGWRIGWESPGDVGAPTTAQLDAPPGFEVHGPLYPVPRAFALDDGRALFAYEREALLYFRVRAPSDLPAGQRVAFELQASWTAIGASVVPGHATLAWSLPTHPLSDPAAGAGADALERLRGELPLPWKQLERAALDWVVAYADTGEGQGLELTLAIEGASRLEYFPRPIERLDYAEQRLEPTEHGARLVVAYQSYPRNGAPPPDLQGVLRVVRGGVESCYEVRANRPVPLGAR